LASEIAFFKRISRLIIQWRSQIEARYKRLVHSRIIFKKAQILLYAVLPTGLHKGDTR